jgi:hypothetical protein
MKYSKSEVQEATNLLHKWLKPGDTVYTILRNVSRSGMSRRIDLYVCIDGHMQYLSGAAAVVLGDPRPTDGIKVSGCGMDMGFHLVSNLGYTLWPKGTDKPHGTRNGEPDTSGGYALKHQWI